MTTPTKTYKYYWEDFPAGSVREFGGKTMTAEEIMDFARQFDPQPFHLSEEAGKNSLFGGLCASGWHTCALAMRMMCDAYLLESASLGSPGLENIRWLKPVRPGDTLHVRSVVLEARPMDSKPHVGLLRTRWEMINQNNEEVMQMEGYGMFRRRDVAKPDASA
ncbi:MaoC family dehydratase [Sulfuritalea hydrogenivorans]|jgi:acyl dehydratase|uniref:MaoC-like protein n=1 Tax=Sulfuritalea hydrogenivorans sk43H TaxID=1223802 RepID=W0SH73_9PROT|nr:MaoC family dehydratase [Sulfuritalea hydrogenivorans]MDK9712806.1 MaoC family dehydratase [Sulfuritalea sp.]BAO30115.1 MaoC-like protein [Sulfuritalea hydrogenivorans sk43H]